MSNVKGKVVVITGASSGIGDSTARLLAQHGAHVVIGARRMERLEALASSIRWRADRWSIIRWMLPDWKRCKPSLTSLKLAMDVSMLF